jgi:hypothetical protein
MKKPAKITEKHFGYGVKIHSRCDHSERSDEQYGSWHESYTNSISAKVQSVTEYPDVVSTYEIAPGSEAWVVWVEYSTGDSFGHADRNGTEVIGIFSQDNFASAQVLQAGLEKQDAEDNHAYRIETPDGQVFESNWAPWSGYFEHLDTVHIDQVVVV